jgi:tetratricopeptide (TPR) repeat protein
VDAASPDRSTAVDPQEALRLATADPVRARALAGEARRAARNAGDPDGESVAERALGLVARELHDAARARRHLRRAIAVADRAGLAVRRAEAQMSLAFVLDEAGRPAEALRELDTALAALSGLEAARARMQQAVILDRLGRSAEALDGYNGSLAVFRRAGDRLWQARALSNRGIFHAYRGAIRQAHADLRAAEQLHTDLGQPHAVAQVRHNLGFVAARAGDVPTALRFYDLADEYFARAGRPPTALVDRGELLLRARLLAEARQVTRAALDTATAGRMALYEAHARLMLAEIALATGDRSAAGELSAAATRAFVRQGRPGWAALARYCALRATDPGPAAPAAASTVRAAMRIADQLSGAGWPAAALDARLYVARLAAGRPAAAAALRQVRATGRRGPAELRARAWHAEALLRADAGDRAGARRALRAGIDVLDRYRAALGATELRSLASSYAVDLAASGLRLAVSAGRPKPVLWWAERCRAASLRTPPTRPPDEGALAADLAELRHVVAAVDEHAGEPARVAGLLRQQRALEERVRRRSWHASGTSENNDTNADLTELSTVVGDATLVELVELDGSLIAVVVTGNRYHWQDLGPTGAVTDELEALRFALLRIVRRHGSPASLRAAEAAARHAVQRLDRAVFGPVRHRLGTGPLVVVPVGALHALPWALVPTCQSRPLTVAPSAAVWLTARRPAAAPPAGRPVLVAGPGLAHAEDEVCALAGHLASADVYVGATATVDRVVRSLPGAPLAHLATHGRFRADNPMFSYLRLADGRLTVYDLEGLARPPATVVLSACESGLSAVRPGEELMGLTAALLGIGTADVLASVLPVHDGTAPHLMLHLHRLLAEGVGPAAALSRAQAELGVRPDGPLDAAAVTAASMVCFGAGWT